MQNMNAHVKMFGESCNFLHILFIKNWDKYNEIDNREVYPALNKKINKDEPLIKFKLFDRNNH